MGDFRLLEQTDSTSQTAVEGLREGCLGWMERQDLVLFESGINSGSSEQAGSELADILGGFEIIDPGFEKHDASDQPRMDFDRIAELPEQSEELAGRTSLEVELYGLAENDEFVSAVRERTLDRIPNRIEEFLADNNQKLVLADRLSSIDIPIVQYGADFHARNYNDGSKVGDLPAFYYADHIVGVKSCPQYESTGSERQGPTDEQIANTTEKLIHECGHGVNEVLKLSDDPQFKEIFERELPLLKSSDVTNRYYFANTPSETVAELFAAYCEKDVYDTDGSSKLADTMPDTYKWLSDRFDAIGESSD